MRKYTFVSVPISRRREGLSQAEDYQEIIRTHAADGWKFVQAISFEQHVDPRIDLVFTRKD
ncbi:DUF4177 domain-containing protein [Salinibacterium sp. UTAS2018]|uniref:DUF4177 domain-containing protein n=1 Tax=Salinibacterium sp. UTAS2018 TaxID=2508880 RepID=UPI001009834E|nr:DUF4177 domain-containing protein [Salinibacterium sp. UTAS2018]QAV71348.1 DUF4177 domain-containing protein [Salinibacterium sp. UTAS2018]